MLDNALRQAGLSRLATTLTELARPSIRLLTRPAQEHDISLGQSKIGGYPDLPKSWEWPTMDLRPEDMRPYPDSEPPKRYGAIPLAFVAQINLTDILPYDTEHVLPTAGMLYFFTDAMQEYDRWDDAAASYAPAPDRWRVLYSAGAAPDLLTRVPFPETLPQEGHFQPHSVELASELTVPDCALIWDKEGGRLSDDMGWYRDEPVLTESEYEAYWRFQAGLAGYSYDAQWATPPVRAGLNRMFGYPDLVQNPMELACALESHGIPELATYPELIADPDSAVRPEMAARAEALRPAAPDWCLLLQIDSIFDDDAMMWGDMGRIYYWIQRQDLARGHFADVWFVLQCV